MAIPLNQLPSDLIYNGQLDISNPVKKAKYDALNASYGGGGGGNSYGFNFESEVDKAFEELGTYYNRIIDEAGGDLNKALSRLKEDYDTGKRFREQNFNLNNKAMVLAQDSFAKDATQAFKTLQTRQLARGINRGSMYDPGGDKGIADTERGMLNKDVASGQAKLDLNKESAQLGFDQQGELADTNLLRGQTDLPVQFDRFKKNAEEERKYKAGELALSRQQRAYQRFEAGLV